jgi:hypothetical protein
MAIRSSSIRRGQHATHRFNHQRTAYARARRGRYSDRSNLPQDVQDHLFKEAVASQGESTQLAVFLHDKHTRTVDPLGDPREMKEPDSLGD